MGRRGPAPKPENLRVLHGEKEREDAPKPAAGSKAPKPPDWLPTDAKQIWRRLAKEMHDKGVLTGWDLESFAVFCYTAHQYRKAVDLVDKALLVPGREGTYVKNPAVQILRDTANTLRAFAQEFGLTPSARSGIEVGKALGDTLEQVLSGSA